MRLTPAISSGIADVLEARLRQAQAEKLAPLDMVAALVADELQRRQDRLFERRHKQARFRDPDRSLDRFDFDFNKKMNKRGHAYIRMLLTHGARAVLWKAKSRKDPDQLRAWALRLEQTRGHNKAAIALANKLCAHRLGRLAPRRQVH